MSEKKEIKRKYDFWLHWFITEQCTFDCVYCTLRKGTGLVRPAPIAIAQLMQTLGRTGKTFMIGFTGGGEPFLVPNLVEACQAITREHYILLHTNLTNSRIKEFGEVVNPERVQFIVASLHLKELEKHNLLERYQENFFFLQQKGFRIRAREVAYPSLVEEVKMYRDKFLSLGIEIQFDPFLGEYKNKSYPSAYSDYERAVFGLDREEESSASTFYNKGTICNAGCNVAIVDARGDIYPCELMRSSLGNIYERITFNEYLIHCPFTYCGCPLNLYDPFLFNKALEQFSGDVRQLSQFFLFSNFLKRQWHKGKKKVMP